MFSLFWSESIAVNQWVGINFKNLSFTEYVNNFDEPVLYACPNGGYLNGVNSVHDNVPEDRKFKFRCCTPMSGIFFPHILFFKTTKEFKIFCLLLVFVLWNYFACPLYMSEMLLKQLKIWNNQWIGLSIFLKDITTKTACGPIGPTIGIDVWITPFHPVTLSWVWKAFTTTINSKYDID